MLAPQALMRLLVSRVLPQPNADSANIDEAVRGGRYGELYTLPLMRKAHALLDEGSYFVANNSGTGVATVAAPTAFSDTAPLLTIANIDVPTNSAYKRIYLDWLRLTETAAGTAGVDLRLQIVLDTTVPSGGTVLTPLSPNMDTTGKSSVASIRLLGTGVAQTANSRVAVGTLQAIQTLSAAIPAQTEALINFGGVEGAFAGFANILSTATSGKFTSPAPPIIIGPGQIAMFRFLITSQSAASSWTAELGWWER